MPLEDLNETLKIMPHIVGLQHITGNTYMKDFLYRIRQHMESSEDLGLLLENRCEINEAGEFVIYEEKSADARNRAVYHIVRVSGYRFVLAFMLLLKEGVNQKKPHFNPKKWVLEVAQGLAAFAEDCQSDEGYMKKCFDYFSLINNLQLFLTKRQKLELREEYGPILANSPALMAVLCTRTPSHYRELLRFTEEAKTKPLTEEAKTKPLTEEAKTKARACKSITKLNLKLRTLHLVMKSDQAAAQSELSELIAQLAEKTTAGLFLAQSEIEKHAEEIFGDMAKAANQHNTKTIKEIIDKFITTLTEEEVKKFFPGQYEVRQGKLIVLSDIEKAAMPNSGNARDQYNSAINAFLDASNFIEGEPRKSCCLKWEERAPATFVLSQISIKENEGMMILADIEKAVMQGNNESTKRVIEKVIKSLTRNDMARLFLNQCEINEGKFTIFSDIEEVLDDLDETAIFQLALDSDLEAFKYFIEQLGTNEKAKHCLASPNDKNRPYNRGSTLRAIAVANAVAASSSYMKDEKDEAQCIERAKILLLDGVQQLPQDNWADNKSFKELYWQTLENSAALVKHCQPELERLRLYAHGGGKRTRPDAAAPSTRISKPECKIGNEENISQIQ